MKQKINKIRKFCQKHDYLFLIISTIIYELIVYLFNSINNITKIIIFLLPFIILLFLFDKKRIDKNIFYIIYIMGIIVRTKYILNTDINTRQHDVYYFDLDDVGHLAYIKNIFQNLKLPATNDWQFYHPPLWHMICALWLKIMTIIKTNIDTALEGIQILSLLFSSYIIIIVDKICYELKLKKKYRIITDMLFVIHPTMIIFSGSINNDCLLTFLEFLTIFLLIKWYENSSWKNTIALAIITGLTVMTKANGALMAVPIIYIFIIKLIHQIKNNRQQIKLYIYKILCFSAISLPIGLWFQVRNIILFGKITSIPGYNIPLTNIDKLTNKFLSLNIDELMNYAYIRPDQNLPAFIIKSSIFGEWSFENISILKNAIIITNLILIVLSIIFIIGYLFWRKKNIYINMMLITWTVYMISMCLLNYHHPETCSMDFRYIVICLLPGIATITYILNYTKNKRYLKIPIFLVYFSFIIMCCILSIKIF